jgi:FtsZ-interacting cell division protein ZipA
MSDLQVALIILGGFIIAGVVVYNWMQERKLRHEVTNEFIVPQKDVLADDFNIDADAYKVDRDLAEVTEKFNQTEHASAAEAFNAPTVAEPVEKDFNDDVFTEAVEAQEASARESRAVADAEYAAQKELQAEIDQELHEELAPAQAPEMAPEAAPEPIVKAVLHEQIQQAQVHLPEITHSQIDLSAIFYLNKNITGKDLSALSNALAGINLPVTLHGLDNQDKWHVVSEGAATTFKQVACSVQLADRGGPIAKNLLNKFQFAVEDAGLELNAHVEWQGSGDALQRAIELDQFCIEVDQMISVHVAQGDAPIHGTKFKGLAEASGMTLKDDGKFHFFSNEVPLFIALDTNNVPFTAESLRSNVLKSVTFQIEIPKVSNCEQVFNQMIIIAQKMASSLNASLVDDNQKPLGDLQIEKIRQQLKVIHATMVARGIMPGSLASMRLFN